METPRSGASAREMMAGELEGMGLQGNRRQAYQRSVDMVTVVWRMKQKSRYWYAGYLGFGLELLRWQLKVVEVEAVQWIVKLRGS
jgi:hypothetical protein